MRAIVILTIAAVALTANGAPLTDTTTSNNYEDQFLFILKLICPNTKIVYVNGDGTEGILPSSDIPLNIEIDDKLKQEIRDIHCPEFSDSKDNELMEYKVMNSSEIMDPISSTTLASTTSSTTVSPLSTTSNYEDDFLTIIKHFCPNTQIMNLNSNTSGTMPTSISQNRLNFEQMEKLKLKIQESHCPQLLSNKDNGTMAIKYSTTTLSESTTTTSATTDINYQDALWLIIQLLCPSTKLIYLNDDGTEGTFPAEQKFELDESLKQKIQKSNCPKFLSFSNENVSKVEEHSPITPSKSSTTENTTLVSTTISTTDASINTSSTTVPDYKNDILFIINFLCPNTQMMYLNSDGSEGVIPINYTVPNIELDDELKQKIQKSHCPELSNDKENASKTEKSSTVTFTDSTSIASITTLASTTTFTPSVSSTTAGASSITSTTTIAPSTTSTIVANYEDDILLIIQLLCSSYQLLYSNNNSYNGTMPFSQDGLDEKIKQEMERLNCSEFSYENETKSTNESASTTSSTVNSTTDTSATTSTTVTPATTTETVIPATTSNKVTPTVSSTTVVPSTTTAAAAAAATTTSTIRSPYYRNLLLMIKLVCPNTKIVFLNNDDLELSKEINQMEPGSNANDKLRQNIRKSHCPKLNNHEEIEVMANDFSMTTSSESTVSTIASTTTSTPSSITAAPTTTTNVELKVSSTTYSSITTGDSASPVRLCHPKNLDCFLTNIIDKFMDFLDGTVQSVAECLKQ